MLLEWGELEKTKDKVYRLVVPLLSGRQSLEARHGGVQAVFWLVAGLQEAIVPYLFLLVVPTMGCMSDHHPGLRIAATSSFASMVALLPLAQVHQSLLSTLPEPV